MFYVTGDTHIPYDISKLNTKRFPEQKSLSKDDYLIVCGDFGGIWKENSRNDLYWLKWLESKNFTTLFVDGNHENFDLLNALPIENWNGGKIHRIRESILHLMRGQVYKINGFTFFCMGGGASGDKEYRKEGISWWNQEMPCADEYIEAWGNLEKVGFCVDYVITHTAPISIIKQFRIRVDELPLNDFLEKVMRRAEYKKWYFGHVHENLDIDDKHTALYDCVLLC